MSYILPRDTLWSLLTHRSQEVREWALTRLHDLYPEAEADLLHTLPHATPEVASSMLSRFRSVACPPELHTFFQRTTVPLLKARAAALLIRAGHGLPAPQLAAVNLSHVLDLLADTVSGFDFLLQRYGNARSQDAPLLGALSQACGSAEILALLHDVSGKKDRRSVLDALGAAWGCDLSDLRNIRQAHEACKTLEQALAVLPAMAPPATLWQEELCNALAGDCQRLAAISEMTKTHLPQVAEASPADTDFLVSCTLALRRDARCQRLLLEAQDSAAVWQAIVLRPWHAEVGAGLVHFFSSLEPTQVVEALRQALTRPYAYAEFPFTILNTLDTPGRFTLFLEAYQGAYDEQFMDEGKRALRAAGPAAAAAVVEHFRHHLPEPMHLFILGMLPTAEVETFLLAHMDHYMTHPWSRYFVEVLELLASERFLAPLLQEWRPGEAIIGRTITLIAAVHGVQHAELQRIRRDTEAHDRAFKRFQARASKNPDRALQGLLEREGPLNLPLRCTACGRTYHYDVTKVFVHPKRVEDYHLGQIIQCKGCDSIETYEQTPVTQLAVSAEIMRLGLLVEYDKRQSRGKRTERPATPIIVQKLQLMAAGRYFDSISDAYRFLKDKIAQEPSNAELHRRLGNVLKNGERPDLAMPVYLEAIRLDPTEAEAYYNIVEILIAQERHRDAIPYLDTLIRLCRENAMDEKLRRDMFASLLEQVVVVERKTGQRLDLFPVPDRAEVASMASEHDETPPVVYLTSFDLSDPNDFERMYQVFRTGRMPEETPRRGLARWLPGARSPEATPQTWQLPAAPVRTAEHKVGRNAPCPCGSGRKYKRCCGR